MFERLLPCGNAVLDLVSVQAIESVSVQVEPGGVGIVMCHHFPPGLNGQHASGLEIPRYWGNLKRAILRTIEHGSAEQHDRGNRSAIEPLEVFCGRNVEVKRAWDVHFDLCVAAFKRRHHDAGVCPEKVAQGVAPSVRTAEQITQAGLFRGRVASPGDLNLYLA